MAQNEFWQGNKAIAMGAIAAGCRYFGGYPITPSTEIMEVMSEELPKLGGKFVQMEDEIGGIASALGASIAGKKAMTASSGPGISLKQELLGYGYIAEIPLVVADVQRGGPSTGLPTKGFAGRRNAGQMGNPRRPRHDSLRAVLDHGVLHSYDRGVQHGRAFPPARPCNGRRSHRTHA